MHHPNASSIDVTASFMQAALSTRGINAIVSPLWNGPQLQTLQVSLAVGVRPERVERLSGALAMAAGVDHCRISRASGYLLIEIAKPPHERQVLRARRMLEHQPPSSWQVPIGVSTIGQIVWFDLSDERNCHAVLGGTTRSGKTNLLHWLLFRLMTQNGSHHLQVLLMDPKGFELQPLAHSRHLIHPPEHRPGEIYRILLWVQDRMARRSQARITQPRILIVIDEVRELVEQEPRIQRLLASIAQIGAGLGIHLIVTTQQPGARALGDALANLPARLLGRVASSTLTYGAAGRARSQADMLLGRGDFLLITQDHLTRFQAPLMDPELIEHLPTASHIPQLDLAERIDMSTFTARDRRGGHNRKPLDPDYVRQLVLEQDMTPGQLSHALTINYDRAQRLVAITQAVAQGADANQVSLTLDIPLQRARELVEQLGNPLGRSRDES